MVITVDTIITGGAIVSASGLLCAAAWRFFKWLDEENSQREEIKAIKAEQCQMCYALLACLDGLKQLNCNGKVTDAHEKLAKHLNKQAHDLE